MGDVTGDTGGGLHRNTRYFLLAKTLNENDVALSLVSFSQTVR